MKYIIMCGGDYRNFSKTKQLIKINGEPIVARTIRLLRECGIQDIAISSNNPAFDNFGVPVLHHNNQWTVYGYNDVVGTWCNGFYPTEEPVCYVLGDVVFSKNAIRTIINTETNDIEFFASSPPFAEGYLKEWAEPFAFKVVNQEHFKESIEWLKLLESKGYFAREPLAWELWQVIKGTPLNRIDYENYVIINDYSCDIDYEKEAELFNGLVD